MARAPKLKVYATSIGFYDALVAAPSQKAALRAWGTKTDLFSAGRATLVADPDLQADALAHPGEVVKRPHGNAKSLIAQMEAEERAETSRPKRELKVEPATPQPDRSELDAAERALAEAGRELRNSLDALAAERAELDTRERDMREIGDERIRELTGARKRAEAAYKQAGGA